MIINSCQHLYNQKAQLASSQWLANGIQGRYAASHRDSSDHKLFPTGNNHVSTELWVWLSVSTTRLWAVNNWPY